MAVRFSLGCAIAGALGFPLAAGAQTGSTPPPTPTAASPSTATPAQPRKPLAYVNAGLASAVQDSDGFRDELDDPTVVLVRAGTGLSRGGIGQYFAIEAELGTGLGTESDTFEGATVRSRIDNEIDSMVALVGVARIPLKDRGFLFLRTGWGSHKRTTVGEGEVFDFDTGAPVESFRDDFSQSVSGFAFGIGAEGFFGRERRNGVRLDIFAVGEDTDEFDRRGDPLIDVSGYTSLAFVRRF